MSWTGARPPARRKDWEVRDLDRNVASRLIAAEHYSRGSAKQAAYLHGLFPAGNLWEEEARGAAHWMPPTQAVARCLLPGFPGGVLALSRLAVMEEVGGNGATLLLAGSMRRIDRERWPVLVTYADSWRGHTGGIYKATGWSFDGETAPKPVWTLNGRMISSKAGPKTRTVAEMRQLGAELVGNFSKLRFVHRGRAACL